MHLDAERRFRRRILWFSGIGLAATLAVVASLPWVSGRNTPPTASRQTAARTLTRAREAGAERWARPALAEAEALQRAALAEFRRQELRFAITRDFDETRRQLHLAESAALRAAKLAAAEREASRDASAAALSRARCAWELTESLLGGLRADREGASLLQVSKIHLREAELLWAEDEFDRAHLRADQAGVEAQQARERMAPALARFVDPATVTQWRRWRADTIAQSAKQGSMAIVVNKEQGRLALYQRGKQVKLYRVEVGREHLQRKSRSGDTATPEGQYRVITRKGRGSTKYHRALELDYPNAQDRERFEKRKRAGELPANARMGTLIEIHGEGGRGWDWTDGCVAMTNADMEDLFDRVAVGTPVTIIGGVGDDGRFSEIAKFLESGVEHECRAD